MCTIMVKPEGILLEESKAKEWTENMVSANPDGNGVIWEEDGEIRFRKGVEESDLASYASRRGFVAIHTRYSTSGDLSGETMCHPFLMSRERDLLTLEGVLRSDEALLMHNGVVRSMEIDPKLSDSAAIARLLSKFLDTILEDPNAGMELLQAIDDSSRWLLVTKDTAILGGGKWVKHEGVYFSNSHFAEKKIRRGGAASKVSSKTTSWWGKATGSVNMRDSGNKRTFWNKGVGV